MSLRTRLALLIGGAAIVLFLALTRLVISFDLAFFLPEPASTAEAVLTDRLGSGPGSQLVIVHAPGAKPDALRTLADRLRTSSHFRSVLPTFATPSIDSLPPLIWQNRFLLSDLPESVADWQWAFESRLADLSVANDSSSLQLIAADPSLAAVAVLERLGGTGALPPDVVLASTRAPAFDLDAQQQAVTELRSVLHELNLADAQLFGSPVYGVDLQASVQAESIVFTALASIALLLLLVWRLRRADFVLAAAAPLFAGAAGALMALAWLFDSVHGITLAFGFTLLGVAIDHPLHLLSVARHSGLTGAALSRSVWPTLRIGVASTLIGYSAFLLTGSVGLQQLGVMAISGIAVSALVSAWLAQGISAHSSMADGASSHASDTTDQPDHKPRRFIHSPWLIVLTVSMLGLLTLEPFNDDLSALTPLPAERLAADGALRNTIGSEDLRRLVVLRDEDLQRLLRRCEALEGALNDKVGNNEIDGYRLASDLLPSLQRQAERRARVLELTRSRDTITKALEHLPFTDSSFEPFSQALDNEASRQDWLQQENVGSSDELAPLLASMLYRTDNGVWTALVLLSGVSDSLSAFPDGELIDLKSASTDMVSRFRSSLVTVLALALAAMLAFVLAGTRAIARSLWIAGCTGAAIAASAFVGALVLGGLNLFALVALALIAGLGLDYGLFHSKNESTNQSANAVALCAASSLTVFALLACSSIPLLRSIGLTVALGVTIAWILTRFGQRPGQASSTPTGSG
ncbi:MAG: hypothetical protein NXH85_05180 [Pseudomonadaceae bacterium]|nr:hypothetical protein [Pseudomonadaceae bacterium]